MASCTSLKEIYPPLIDLTPFASSTSACATRRQQVALQVRKACIEVGFFQVKSPSLKQSVIDEGFLAAKDFFHLPSSTKKSASAFNSPLFRGYQGSESDSHSCTSEDVPTTTATTATTTATTATSAATATTATTTTTPTTTKTTPPTTTHKRKDLKESFTIGAVGNYSKMHGSNNWPTEDTALLRSIKTRLQVYQNTMMTVALETAQALALSLGLPIDFFVTNMTHAVAQMVLLKYPPPEDALSNRPGCSAHKDCGFLTLLVQEQSMGGLEIYSTDQEWVNVPQLDSCVLINLGDLASEWTNNYYKSTLHRVNNSQLITDRHSVPFFCNLNYNAIVDPIDLCQNSTLSEVVDGIRNGSTGFMTKITAGDYICKKLGLMHDNGNEELQ